MSSSTPSPTGRKSAQVRLFQSSPTSPATSTGDASSSSGKSSSSQQQQQQVKNKKKSNMSAFFATPPSQQPKHHHHHHHHHHSKASSSSSTPTIIPKIMRAPSSVSSTSSTAASSSTTSTTAQSLLLSSNENQTALTASSRSQSSKSPHQRISHTSVSPSRNRIMMSVDTTATTTTTMTTTSGDAQQSNVTTTSPMTKMLLRREATPTPTITTPSTTTSANVTPDRSSKVNRALFTTASTTTPTIHRTSSSSSGSSSSGGNAAIDFMTKNHELNLDRVSQLLTNVTGAKKSESNNLLLVNEFHVVAVMGGRATGKSTLANMIANMTTVDGAMDDRRELHGPFELSGAHELITCERKTRGIQLYVSSDRVLVLDCEALFMDGTGTGGSGSGGAGGGLEHHAMESEMMSLQLGLFLYSVCHVIVIPYLESSLDTHMLRFVRTLDNLKKGIPDLYQSAGPRILFTANDVISHQQGGKQQQMLLSPVDRLLPSHRMLTELHGYDVCVVPHDPSSEDKKLFRDKVFREIDRRFRGSEVEWLHACAKNWEVIRKNYFLSEYTRTVQRIYIST